MADVMNRQTRVIFKRVNTAEYSPDEYIINPVLPDCLPQYYKIVGDEVVEMSAQEKEPVDAIIAQSTKDHERDVIVAIKMNEMLRDMAVEALKNEGVLDSNGNIK